ncbi:ABC transporter family protein [Tritrichomonas foetus]|uniref:ABC transporter family protein n=1 Tax=Tritrichomonas foetus TaxID=1144522 RepID=A0A1J4K3S0_9EUKA|nr:ABC transporter family protein [Tritrichomonas foetus]|eukprot:OHT05618.1 ABC transporter family protein [Tritrichomonas foetus]
MGLSRFQIEFHVVFYKRWFELIHYPTLFIAYGIASILFSVLTGVLSILLYNSWNSSTKSDFSWETLATNGQKFLFYGNETTQPTIKSVAETIQQQSGLTAVVFDTLEEFENEFFETTDQNLYCFGLAVDYFNPLALYGTVYFNSTVSKTEISQAEITSCLLDVLYKLTSPQSSVKFHYEPLNSGFRSAELWSYFGPLLMSVATNYIGAIFAFQVVEDRENYRLHTMLTSGLRLWVYWFANFVFDLCLYEFINIINWIVLVAFRTDAVIQNNWMATFFLFVFQPLHLLPLIYSLSLFFDTLFSVSGFLQNVILMIILIPYFIVTLVFDNVISDETALYISVVPPYNIQNGLRMAAKRAVGKPIDAKEVWTDKFVILYAEEIIVGIIFAIFGFIVQYVKGRTRGLNVKDSKKDTYEMDEDVATLQEEVLSGNQDDQAIVVKRLDKVYVDSYGNLFKAVNNVSLYVQTGEIFGVLGANGAGKTTLMSVITGRTTLTSGEILLFNHKIIQPSDAERFVSICPQFDTHLFPLLTPRQHFWIYGLLKGYEIKELEKEVSEYEDLMNLGIHRNKLVKELSGGNARKLSISLAFLGNSPIIFLDEPTASLDPVARLQAQALIEQKAHGRTILLCTHLLSEAEKLCDRICIMLTGRIHAFGTHQHLSDKYGKSWKIDLGLESDEESCREKVHSFIQKEFPGSEIAGSRFASVTYNIPSASIQLSEVFLTLNNNKDNGIGYTYFTCSMSTLERVFLDIVMQAES